MIQKYGAALISIALVAFAFLKTALADELDLAEVSQLVALVAGAVIVYFVPLLSGPWAGGLKTGAAVVAAAATAIVPFVLQGTITPEQWTIVALAVLNALGVEVGVNARKSGLIDGGTALAGTAAVITSLPDPEGAKALGV
jgi:hypothetical protein